MVQITVPAELAQALAATNEPVCLVDQNGVQIGIASRTIPHRGTAATEITEALSRAKSTAQRRPLRELLDRLEATEAQ